MRFIRYPGRFFPTSARATADYVFSNIFCHEAAQTNEKRVSGQLAWIRQRPSGRRLRRHAKVQSSRSRHLEHFFYTGQPLCVAVTIQPGRMEGERDLHNAALSIFLVACNKPTLGQRAHKKSRLAPTAEHIATYISMPYDTKSM